MTFPSNRAICRASVVAVAVACLLSIARPCRADWDATGGGWTVAAEDALSVRHGDGAVAWNTTALPAHSWLLTVDLTVRRAEKALVGSASLALSDGRRSPRLLVSVRRRAGRLSMVDVQAVTGDKLRTILTSNWVPGDDESFAVRVARSGQSLRLSVYGDKYLVYQEQTPDLPAGVLDAVAAFGLSADAADVDFSAIRLEIAQAEPGHYAVQAEAAVSDLLSHFWSGGLDQGHIVATSHGYPAPGMTDPRGGLWERATMAFVLDAMHRATGDATLSRRLKAEWARLKSLYTPAELEDAGGPLQLACDDCGWDAMYYLVLYRHSGDREALRRAEGLVNNAMHRWRDDELGGGLWYENARKRKSLYGVGVIASALTVAGETGDEAMKGKALGCYRWIEAQLLRPDGLYWCDRDRSGVVGVGTPDHIGEAGSVTFLGGNMAMGVLHARLYRLTGDKVYLERAARTADAIAQKLTANGICLDDRDAWSNGTFAADWAAEVLTLPGIGPRHKELLLRTADSIYTKARTSRGYYAGSWGGPAEGPGSAWGVMGSRPEQITTSANAVNMIVAAALAAR